MAENHRVHFVYVPKHTSWLNHVMIWSSIVARRRSFRSTEYLRDQVLQFIAYFNWTMAKPFKWTYASR